MKRVFQILASTVAVMFIGNQFCLANTLSADDITADESALLAQGGNEKLKTEIAYEMAQITARVMSSNTRDIQEFKALFSYANAMATAKVLPYVPGSQKGKFAYEIAQITSKVIISEHLDIDRAKSDFAYEMAQLTTQIVIGVAGESNVTHQVHTFDAGSSDSQPVASRQALPEQQPVVSRQALPEQQPVAVGPRQRDTGSQYAVVELPETNSQTAVPAAPSSAGNVRVPQPVTVPQVAEHQSGRADTAATDARTLLRTNDQVEHSSANGGHNADLRKDPANISPTAYNAIVDDLAHIGEKSGGTAGKVDIDGVVRYHYAINSGDAYNKNSSGIRAYLGLGYDVNDTWRFIGMFDIEKDIENYNNKFDFSRWYMLGKFEDRSEAKIGSFGYTMAEGNIYDSGFKGVSYSFGSPIKYTMSFGQTEETKSTLVATAKYTDFDYDVEAGLYHYKSDKNGETNTIRTLGANYYFNNLSLGAMYLGASREDANGAKNGYVLGASYGNFKTYRPHTYNIFAKYYNQPLWTYIEHGMNGSANRLNGFKGWGFGLNYTLSENLVWGTEFDNLTDKETGLQGRTLWNEVKYYF